MSNTVTDSTQRREPAASRLPAIHYYQAAIDRARNVIAEMERKSAGMSWLRTVLFLIAATGLIVGYAADWYSIIWLVIGWSAAAGFIVAVVVHEQIRQSEREARSDKALFEHLCARVKRDWEHVAPIDVLPRYKDQMIVDDLDLGGRGGLLSLISLVQTANGNERLQDWIFQHADWDTVRRRQRAVQHLVDKRELRTDFLKRLSTFGPRDRAEYGLAQWAKEPDWLQENRKAYWAAIGGMTLALLGAAWLVAILLTGHQEQAVGAICLLAAGFVVNIMLTVLWGGTIHGIFQRVAGEHRAVHRYADVFRDLSRLPTETELLKNIVHAAGGASDSATCGFARLRRLVFLATLQSYLLLYPVYLLLQLSLAWDFHVLWLLERWKRRFGPAVSGWFDALGTFEVLLSLATLADEHPTWAFAEPLSDKDKAIHADELGHPLLPNERRVNNSFTIDRHAPLMLVTGSNMAGKTTFLRAVGVNILLARMGAPCCAQKLETELYELGTSIRIRDSLSDGVSFYLAELQRMKQIIDLATQRQADSPASKCLPPLFFLLDEVLQGTNNRERIIAVRVIVKRLVDTGSVGIVSTHDLDLADCPEVTRIAQVVHFREYFVNRQGKQVMQFDYRLRPGLTPTTNALKMLEMVGLAEQAGNIAVDKSEPTSGS